MKQMISRIKHFAMINATLLALILGFSVTASAAPQPVQCSGVAGLQNGANCAAGSGQAAKIDGDGGIFKTVVNILLFIVGAVAVIMLVIGGLRYVTSNGDQNAVTGAKNTIMYAIIGIVVAFLAYAAVNFVVSQLSTGTTVQ
jgi:hypothetical protein